MRSGATHGNSSEPTQRSNSRSSGPAARLLLVFSFCFLVIGAFATIQIFPRDLAFQGVPATSVAYLPDPREEQTLASAASELLERSPLTSYRSTLDHSARTWLAVTPELHEKTDRVLEIRVTRAEQASFWLATSLDRAGTLAFSSLTWIHAKGGIAIQIPKYAPQNSTIIGHIRPHSIARPSYQLWNQDAFQDSERLFHRVGGAVFGAFLILAGFSAVIAALNRDKTFLLFAAWLITALRIVSINAGWDPFWLGLSVPAEQLLPFLKFTLAAHAVSTIALFRYLLRDELSRIRSHRLIDYAIGYFLAVLAASPFVPLAPFMYGFWISAIVGMALLVGYLTRVLTKYRSPTAIWYGLSWGVMFAGLASEVLAASGVIRKSIPLLDTASGIIATAFLTAVALSARMQSERLAMLTAKEKERHAFGLLRQTFDTVPSGIFSLGANGNFVRVNPSLAAMLEVPGGISVKSMRWDEFFGEGSFVALREACRDGKAAKIEISSKSSGVATKVFGIQCALVGDRIEGTANDLTAQKIAEDRLRFLADHDPLTGLMNRRGLDAEMTSTLEHVAADGSASIAYIDLDRFKLVNDLFGHSAGDEILTIIAQRLREGIESRHTIARIGGDEFVILFRDLGVHEARAVCESVLDNIRRSPYKFQDKAFTLSGSIGVVAISSEMTIKDAVTASDRACSDAKRLGGSHVIALEVSSRNLREHMAEIRLVSGMSSRFPSERLFTVKQPIVSIRGAWDSLSYEVLVRMKDLDGSTLPPARFIGAAERNGLMSAIDRWVLEDTLNWLDRNPRHVKDLTFLTLNLSGSSLNDEQFLHDAVALIKDFPGIAHKICLEITETVALYDITNTRRFVDKIKALGCKLALDDFGAGYTSFSYLKDIPGDFVKIDGAFVRDIAVNSHNYAITRAIVSLTKELGMRCVAEWAEDIKTVQALDELAVDYAQGYGLSMPLSSEQVLQCHSGGELVLAGEIRNYLRSLYSSDPPAESDEAVSVQRSITAESGLA